MKPGNKIRKLIIPWLEEFELALYVTDPKNQNKLKKIPHAQLIVIVMKLNVPELTDKFSQQANWFEWAELVRAGLPGVAKRRLEVLREIFPRILKELKDTKL